MRLLANVIVHQGSTDIRCVQYPNDIEWQPLVDVDTKLRTNCYDSADQSSHLWKLNVFYLTNQIQIFLQVLGTQVQDFKGTRLLKNVLDLKLCS